MVKKLLTEKDIRSVDGLTSRKAAEVLGVGKSTINNYREIYSATQPEQEFENERIIVNRKGGEGDISVVLHEKLNHEAILVKFGLDPAEVRIVGVLEETHWQFNGNDWNHRYKFKTEYINPEDADGEPPVDGVAILSALRAASPTPKYGYAAQDDNSGEFVISINDTQLGKGEGGGTAATLERVRSFVQLARWRIAELRLLGRKIDTLVIIGGGDIVEGHTIFPNQPYTLDSDMRTQINNAVAMILDAIDTLAPLFSRVVILAAKGNHGENRVNGKAVNLHDNTDVLVWEMAKVATDRDEALQHVEYILADSNDGVFFDTASGWRLGTTHGDVYGKMGGGTAAQKAYNWFKNMSAGRDPMGLVDVLITHHFHHDELVDHGAVLWRQTSAMDGGSEQFTRYSGEYSEPGMLSFVMSKSSRYSDEQVLR